MTLEHMILKYALQNAVKFEGKANPGAVMGKVLAEDPSLKAKMKDVNLTIHKVLKEIHALSVDEQLKQLEAIAPELLEKKEKQERNLFSVFDIKPGQTVKSAFPPGPEKYPHIGHAKGLILNKMLADQYGGAFVLRFEDTNPSLVKKEFYGIMLENFEWLGVIPDEVQYASDHMDLFYKHAEACIKNSNAYVCTCAQDVMKDNRMKMLACACRDKNPDRNLKEWKEMPSKKSGDAVLRLKIGLSHQNTTMRDPVIFRIMDEEHARLGKKYSVWPNYDFQNAIMDGAFHITHRVRTKEFEMRSELQRYIQDLLKLPRTQTYELGRFNMEGVESSGRIIRQLVQEGTLIGWDDPSLTTIVALRRRGFLPEAIKNFVVSTGITKNDTSMTWDDLIVHNKRILDNIAPRYFMIHDPMHVEIKGAPIRGIELNLNPNEKAGGRPFQTNDAFILSRRDIEECKDDELMRLMDCLNFVKQGKTLIFKSTDFMEYKKIGKKIMHWLPSKGNVDIEILMPDKSILRAIAEHNITTLEQGAIIQFERFGFCRLDGKKEDTLRFWFTHR